MDTKSFVWLWNTMLQGQSSDTVYVMRVVFQTKKEVPQTTIQRENRIREVDNLFLNAVNKWNNTNTNMLRTQATECRLVDDSREWEVFFIGYDVELDIERWRQTALTIIQMSCINTQSQRVDYIKTVQKADLNSLKVNPEA
jgi:hypothetical protein